MTKERYPKKFCKLRNTTVTVLEQGLEELGQKGVMEWLIAKCLNQDNDCNNLDCQYVHRGLGDSGSKDPFN